MFGNENTSNVLLLFLEPFRTLTLGSRNLIEPLPSDTRLSVAFPQEEVPLRPLVHASSICARQPQRSLPPKPHSPRQCTRPAAQACPEPLSRGVSILRASARRRFARIPPLAKSGSSAGEPRKAPDQRTAQPPRARPFPGGAWRREPLSFHTPAPEAVAPARPVYKLFTRCACAACLQPVYKLTPSRHRVLFGFVRATRPAPILALLPAEEPPQPRNGVYTRRAGLRTTRHFTHTSDLVALAAGEPPEAGGDDARRELCQARQVEEHRGPLAQHPPRFLEGSRTRKQS
jgi:hypothetical protein